MTVLCSYCLRDGRLAFVGEKCPECGSAAIKSAENYNHYTCLSGKCSVIIFYRGEGGISHGMCAACYDRESAPEESNSMENFIATDKKAKSIGTCAKERPMCRKAILTRGLKPRIENGTWTGNAEHPDGTHFPFDRNATPDGQDNS